MDKHKDKLEHDLEKVAKAHGMTLQSNCAYCGRNAEVVDTKGEEVGYFFTFIRKVEE